MVAGNEVLVLLCVIKDEGEDAVQLVEEVDSLLLVLRKDNLAVRAGLEGEVAGQRLLEILMVVNLAVHCKDIGMLGVVERLCPVHGINDREALVDQNAFVIAVDAGPVRAAVALQL